MRTLVTMVVVLALNIAASHPGWGSDELERELVRHDAELTKAQQTYDEAVTAANDKALKAIVRIAQRQAKAGDAAGATLAWKEVLRLQRTQAEARAHFTMLGTLDAVLAELDQPPTDLLGNPILDTKGRPVLLFTPESALVPNPGTILTTAFTTRTIEMVVGRAVGDGLFFEEGGPANGQALGLLGQEVIYVTRADGKMVAIKAPFDRKAPWIHIAAQFSAGEIRLWLNGTLVAKGSTGFSSIPAHGDGGLGKGRGPNPGEWQSGCQFALAAFRMTGSARYTDQLGPDGAMTIDKGVLLGVSPETILAELPQGGPAKDAHPIAIKKISCALPGNPVWVVNGDVEAMR